MKSSQTNLRLLLIAGAWLASIAITYSLGRIGASEERPAVSDMQPVAGGLQNAGILVDGVGTGKAASAFLTEEGNGGSAGTVEAVTGGEPLDTWLKRLLSQDDEIVRASAFLRLLESLNSPEDLRKALEIVSAQGGRDRWRGGAMKEASMLLQKWAQMDPKSAAAFAHSKNGGERFFASGVILRTWARSNPEEALAYAQANGTSTNSEDGNWYVAAVVSQMAKTDVDRALQVAAGQERSRARGGMVDSILSELFAQRGEDGARNTLLNMPPGPFRDALAPNLARRLADKDGAGTAQWVMSSLPAGEVRGRALAEVINEWADNDAVAAGKYLSQLPVSTETDSARERYAGEVLRQDPEGALAWAGTISVEEQRTRVVGSLVRAWMRRDRAAAEKWVASAQLPENMRAQLLRN